MSDVVYSNLDNDSIMVLRALADEGQLTASVVVEAATPESSPLHRHFTWDDSQAGNAWRLSEARQIIRRVRVVLLDKPAPPVRAFVNIQEGGSRRYADVFTVLNDQELRDQHRVRLFKQMRKLHSELLAFEEFAVVAGAIEEVTKAA